MSDSKARFNPFQVHEETFDSREPEQEPSYVVSEENGSEQKGYFESVGTFTIDPSTTVMSETTRDLLEAQRKAVLIPRIRVNWLNRFKVLQKWEGTILDVWEDGCRARIRDLTSPGSIEEITFSLEEIPEPDLQLVKPGAIFYWSIGYEDHLDGQRNKVSSVRFRRISSWTEKELTAARREAESLKERLGWK